MLLRRARSLKLACPLSKGAPASVQHARAGWLIASTGHAGCYIVAASLHQVYVMAALQNRSCLHCTHARITPALIQITWSRASMQVYWMREWCMHSVAVSCHQPKPGTGGWSLTVMQQPI